MSNGLLTSVDNLRGTERIVAPNLDIDLPPFQSHNLPGYGRDVLLVIPTANKSKCELLTSGFELKKPEGVTLHSIAIPFESGVGEQPYNEAGVIGAHTRISNALRHIDTPSFRDTLASKKIGTVIVASIENFIQLDKVERPTDFGMVVIHNASIGQTTAGLSLGVTVPRAYVNRARRFGFDEGNSNYGRVTVGQVLAAYAPGLDKANWHSVAAGRSRYDLLGDVIDDIEIPW